MFQQSVLKEGNLEKLSSGLLKKWQSRYFELAGHYLKYYQDKQTKSDKVLKGTIDVHDIREVTVGKDGIILMTLSAGGGKIKLRHPSGTRESSVSWADAVLEAQAMPRKPSQSHGHRAETASALGEVTVIGGDAFTITSKELERAGAEALAPYVRENTRLRTLVLRKTKLGAEGMRVMADALKRNTVLTVLDVSENELKVEGAKAVAELVR